MRRAITAVAAKVSTITIPEAFDLIEDQGLNGDEKTYLWGMLDSKIRSGLKTEGQHRAMAGVPK